MTRLRKRDHKMLRIICHKELALVADDLGMKRGTLYKRLDWLRQKKVECQNFVNQLLAYEKQCPKLKKLLTPSTGKKKQ